MKRSLFIKNSILQGPQGLQGAQGPQGVVIQAVNTADSATLTNFTTAQTFSLTWQAPANYFTVGKVVRVRWGIFLVPGAAQNITLEPRIATQGLASPAYATTAQNYEAEVELQAICRSTGATGKFQTSSRVFFMAEGGGTPQPYGFPAPGTFTIDTTGAITFDLQITSSVANNSAIVRAMVAESMN